MREYSSKNISSKNMAPLFGSLKVQAQKFQETPGKVSICWELGGGPGLKWQAKE